jgi:hypothetical protein
MPRQRAHKIHNDDVFGNTTATADIEHEGGGTFFTVTCECGEDIEDTGFIPDSEEESEMIFCPKCGRHFYGRMSVSFDIYQKDIRHGR